MLVNHKTKSIFIHNPKTMGTSISAELKEKYGYINIFGKHDKISKISPDSELATYFKFGVVRNPYEWLTSYYAHIRKTNNRNWKNYLKVIKNNNQTGFKHWLKWVLNSSSNDYQVPADDLSSGQYDWFYSDDMSADFIVNMSNLKESLVQLQSIHHINVGNYRLNVNKQKKDTSKYYTPVLIKKVNQKFKKDFITFEFKPK